MGKIVVNCSSIYNIDFANALFYKIENPHLNFLFFLNDKAKISDNMLNRKYISRLALPLFEWEKDHENEWKILHIPIERLDSSTKFIEAIEQISKSIEKFYVNCEASHELFCKTTSFIKQSLEKVLATIVYTPIVAYASLVKILICSTLRSHEDIEIKYSGELYEGDIFCNQQIKALEYLFHILKKENSSGLRSFTKGGKVLIHENDEWIEYDCAFIRSGRFCLHSKKLNKSFDAGLLMLEDSIEDYKMQFRGPLELLLFMQFGFTADLAYYVPSVFSEMKTANIEYISPISVSDISRVSLTSGGLGFRLIPGGYSLIDYQDGGSVINIIRSLVKNQNISLGDLDDWHYLINNYPRTNEKLSENQHGVKKIISDLDRRNRKAYRNGTVDENNFTVTMDKLLPTKLGQVLLSLTSFLNHIKEILSPYTNISINVDLVHYLRKQGILKGTVFQVECFLKMSDELFSYSIQILQCLKINEIEIDLLKINYEKRRRSTKLTELVDFDINEKTFELYYKSLPLVEFNEIWFNVIIEYYKFIIFFLSSVLKANILTSAMCLGFDSYLKNINLILNSRAQKKSIIFQPNFFQEG